MQTTQREIKVLDETHFFTAECADCTPATRLRKTLSGAFLRISRVGKGYHAAVIAYGETEGNLHSLW